MTGFRIAPATLSRAAALAVLILIPAGPAAADDDARPNPRDRRINEIIDARVREWTEFYKICHENPELSLHEKESAERVARAFEAVGLKVTRHVGGFGVVGVMSNGEGPVVLVRGDMDALPVTEETGLPYASKAVHTETDGSKVGVMHACGHDMHMTVLTATARTLVEIKDHWSGTLLFIAQPAEEIGQGARLMLEDGLYTRFPKPDYALALHVSHELMTGTIGYTSGYALANVDSVDITIHGKGGHGAYPHQTVDPIVTAAQLVLALQTIVSRRLDPRDPAVVTIGSLHAGSKHNVIANTATLQLTVRSYTDEVRRLLLDSIRQISVDTCKAAGCSTPPDVQILEDDFTPATYNDPGLSADCVRAFEEILGRPNVIERRASMGGEDFARYSRDAKDVKGFMYWLGVVEPAQFAAAAKPGADPLPAIHSSRFKIDVEPTIRTGVKTMSTAVLEIVKKK